MAKIYDELKQTPHIRDNKNNNKNTGYVISTETATFLIQITNKVKCENTPNWQPIENGDHINCSLQS